MVRRTILVRHGLSEANNRYNFGTPLFGSANAPLMLRGWYDAFGAGETLRTEYGIDPVETPVATSTMKRTGQTALGMGFLPERMTAYPVLDEVAHGIEPPVLKTMLDNEIYPEAALRQADALLDTFPKEPVVVTHGLLASAALYLAGVPRPADDPLFVQTFASARVLIHDESKRLDLDEAIRVQRDAYRAVVRES